MNATREERRQVARAKAEELRKEQAAREKRNRNILIAALVAIVALVVVVGVVIFNESKKTLLDDFDGARPAGSDNRGGITVGAAGAGEANAGAADLQVYLDFMCVYCAEFENVNSTDLAELRGAGDLNVTYHIMGNMGEFSVRSANAAATVANDAPDLFAPFIEGIFALDPSQIGGLTDEQIAEVALEVGVPQEVVDTFAAGTFNDWVGVATQQDRRDGVTGTPSVFFDGDRLPEDVNYFEPGVLAAWLAEQGVGN